MAFIDRDSDPTDTLTFYNVDEAVGYGSPNLTEDVKVVQFFLKRVYTVDVFKPMKPWGEMVADGKCGPITRAWITKFQIDLRKFGYNVMVDGIVNKAGNANNPDNWTTSISHTVYLMRYLNNALRVHDTAVYKTLPTNPEVPPDVRVVFQKIQAAGPPMNFEQPQVG